MFILSRDNNQTINTDFAQRFYIGPKDPFDPNEKTFSIFADFGQYNIEIAGGFETEKDAEEELDELSDRLNDDRIGKHLNLANCYLEKVTDMIAAVADEISNLKNQFT